MQTIITVVSYYSNSYLGKQLLCIIVFFHKNNKLMHNRPCGLAAIMDGTNWKVAIQQGPDN